MQLLSNQICSRVDLWFVLGQFPGNVGHVRRLPSEHITIVLHEPNERAFLFDIEAGADGCRIAHVGEAETGLLSLFSRLNDRSRSRLRFGDQENVL